jgi:ELWxxDGT repeat protein
MAATLFTATNGAGNVELWVTDGWGGRATLVTEIAAAALGSGPSNYEVGTGTPLPFAVLNDFAYFSANDGVNGTELWRTDGTAGGTTRVTDFTGETMGMPNGFNPSNILVANNQLFFLGTGPGGQNGVFKSDGTAAGTTFVSATDFPSQFMASGNRVYYNGHRERKSGREPDQP